MLCNCPSPSERVLLLESTLLCHVACDFRETEELASIVANDIDDNVGVEPRTVLRTRQASISNLP